MPADVQHARHPPLHAEAARRVCSGRGGTPHLGHAAHRLPSAHARGAGARQRGLARLIDGCGVDAIGGCRSALTPSAFCAVTQVSWAVEARGYFGMSPVGTGVRMVTLLDRAEEWLASQALPADVACRVQAAADLRIEQWHQAQNQRLTAMRGAELRTLRYQASLLQRCSGAITFAVVSKHATLSIFLAPFLDAIQRWQSFVALISGILAVLVVNIWCASAVHLRRTVGCVPDRSVTQDAVLAELELLPRGARLSGMFRAHGRAVPRLHGRLRIAPDGLCSCGV
jgi:hypothetical protein